MAQATLERALEDIRSLEMNELASVELALRERLYNEGYTLEEWKAIQALVDAGLMKEIKPRYTGLSVDHKPVTIQDKPLSETIIEERR